MAPGSALPVHRHSDQELILTLQGSFSEEAGPYSAKGGFYTVGDLGEFEGGSTHTVVAGADGCVCYRVLAGPVERLGIHSLKRRVAGRDGNHSPTALLMVHDLNCAMRDRS